MMNLQYFLNIIDTMSAKEKFQKQNQVNPSSIVQYSQQDARQNVQKRVEVTERQNNMIEEPSQTTQPNQLDGGRKKNQFEAIEQQSMPLMSLDELNLKQDLKPKIKSQIQIKKDLQFYIKLLKQQTSLIRAEIKTKQKYLNKLDEHFTKIQQMAHQIEYEKNSLGQYNLTNFLSIEHNLQEMQKVLKEFANIEENSLTNGTIEQGDNTFSKIKTLFNSFQNNLPKKISEDKLLGQVRQERNNLIYQANGRKAELNQSDRQVKLIRGKSKTYQAFIARSRMKKSDYYGLTFNFDFEQIQRTIDNIRKELRN